MILVDTWKVWSLISEEREATTTNETQKEFYSWLAEELIDNNYDH